MTSATGQDFAIESFPVGNFALLVAFVLATARRAQRALEVARSR